MVTVNPDKVRFSDLNAPHNGCDVHTVELSDCRSMQHFVTLWFKGQKAGERWAQQVGNSGLHKPEVYHREKTEPDFQPFISRLWPGKESEGWPTHYHIDLAAEPQYADVSGLFCLLPQSIVDELSEHLLRT